MTLYVFQDVQDRQAKTHDVLRAKVVLLQANTPTTYSTNDYNQLTKVQITTLVNVCLLIVNMYMYRNDRERHPKQANNKICAAFVIYCILVALIGSRLSLFNGCFFSHVFSL
jgi:hypothetical protein